MLRTLALALQPLLALATVGSLLACPIDRIAQTIREPLGTTHEMTEVDALESRSTDGGNSNVVYVPASPQDQSSALGAIRKAQAERAMPFNATEIAPHLKDLR